MHIRTVSATCLSLASAFQFSIGVRASQESVHRASLARIRTLDPVLQSALDQGLSLSPTFVALVAHVQRTDVIVYLAQGSCPGRRVLGCFGSVTRHGTSRYVRINLVLLRLAEPTPLEQSVHRLVAQIGHELQHVIEIADDPSIIDGPSLERAYARAKAYRNSDGNYETDAALQVGDVVFKEVTRAHPISSRVR